MKRRTTPKGLKRWIANLKPLWLRSRIKYVTIYCTKCKRDTGIQLSEEFHDEHKGQGTTWVDCTCGQTMII